ncbi:cold-regulated protein 27 [Jatropha curcas]|uniref:cold-regulated protein 27 n=1 Tax=Jatropha curcas TaxID=180498 RepID=UPI0005FBC646|nr:cold-regulated protein 27 [Jatropha curcas]
MEGCRSEIRARSQSSESTGGDSGDFDPQGLQMTETMSIEWTNEKHSLYLKSMESSFVNQLYNSMDLLGRQLQKEMSDPESSQQEHSNTRAPSGQFKVLRGGCWQKINFQRPDSQANITNEPNGELISPWIQHFRPRRKPQESAASHRQATSSSRNEVTSSGKANCSKHSPLCHCYSRNHGLLDSNTEVSDQNFVDEVFKSERGSSTCSSKRMKTQTMGTSINDQEHTSSHKNELL